MKNPLPRLKSSAFTSVFMVAASLMTGPFLRAATVDLGDSASFAVLAGTAITNTGATFIDGDIGTFSGTAVTGIGDVVLTGTNHNGDGATVAAHASLLTAFNAAAAQTATVTYLTPQDLGNTTIGPGVYEDTTSFGVTGILTLDAQGDPDATFLFQMGTTLTTATGSSVLLINGAQAKNVFWQVGSSATLGTASSLAGSILAFQSIDMNTGAVIEGRALAYNGAVTMIGNTVLVPEVSTAALAALGFLTALRRRR